MPDTPPTSAAGRSTPFPYGADSQEEADAIARLGLPLVKAPDVGLPCASGKDSSRAAANDVLSRSVKPLVYVAGPYTHPDPVLNTRAACLLADQIVAMGAAVIVPHLSLLWHAISPASIHDWYNRDLEVLAHCHAVALLPGESTGAEMEVAFARARDIPVYSVGHPVTMAPLRRFIEDWRP